MEQRAPGPGSQAAGTVYSQSHSHGPSGSTDIPHKTFIELIPPTCLLFPGCSRLLPLLTPAEGMLWQVENL